MRRLAASLINDDGMVEVDMLFDIDETGLPFIEYFKKEVNKKKYRCYSVPQAGMTSSINYHRSGQVSATHL